jgi:ring-1,2-phenylacetyl-CoA epoxidase subunit PaaD
VVSDTLVVSRTEGAWRALADVLDPEVPVLSVLDLGIVRDVIEAGDGALEVTLTPTYSGCPATEAIEAAVLAALQPLGPVRIKTRWAPAWTTDWISDDGKRKLREYGIAPPGHLVGQAPIRFHAVRPEQQQPFALSSSKGRPELVEGLRQAQPERVGARPERVVPCPRCRSARTERLSAFGATACKALYRCLDCREPFEHFKPL